MDNNFTGNEQPQYNNQFPQQDMSQNMYQQNAYQDNTYQDNGYQQNTYQQNIYQNNGYQAQQNTYATNGYNQQPYQNVAPKKPVVLSQDVRYDQYGMRWFLFLVWGYLIYMIYSCISGALQMFELADAYSEISYGDLDKLSPLIVIEGLLLLVLAVYSFYTRKLLMNFSVKAPNAVTICIASPIGLTLILILGAIIVSDLKFEEVMELVGSLLASSESWVVWLYLIIYGILIYGNIVYFKNRKHLFNNQAQIKLF